MASVSFDITPIGYKRMTRFSKFNPEMQSYYVYKGMVGALAIQKRFKLPDQFQVVFIVPMAPSWSKAKRELMEGRPHQQKPDVDNLLKALLDALRPGADQTIWDVSARKLWGNKGSISIETYES